VDFSIGEALVFAAYGELVAVLVAAIRVWRNPDVTLIDLPLRRRVAVLADFVGPATLVIAGFAVALVVGVLLGQASA
jgi:hypothetical protein